MAVLVALALYSFNQPAVLTTLANGEHLKAEFTRDYQLAPYASIVKVAGVKVGTVTGTSATDGNRTVVDMKLDNGTLDKLGTEPRAIVRPATLLGGKYYVELVRDGQDGSPSEDSTIPVARTAVPVELDKVLSTVDAGASRSIRRTITSLDKTLKPDGRRQVKRFLSQAPDALEPTGTVLRAARGTQPRTDLPALVKGLQATAAGLSQQQDQVGQIIDGLDATAQGLDDSRVPLTQTVANGPATLRTTQEGLANLAPTLDQLGTTARNFGPSARELSVVITALDPVVVRARPVLADARVVARDALPLVNNAVPAVRRADGVLTDVRGPVLDRANGPIKQAVLSPWHGTGVYNGGGNDHTLYEETGYLLANFADVFKYHDKNGAMGRLMAGVGLSSVGGIVDLSLPEYLQSLGIGSPNGASPLTSPLATRPAGTPAAQPAPTPVPSKSPLKSPAAPTSRGGLLSGLTGLLGSLGGN